MPLGWQCLDGDGVLDAVVLLGALAVVEAVEGANQVAGDAADALEGLGLGGVEAALELLAVDARGPWRRALRWR